MPAFAHCPSCLLSGKTFSPQDVFTRRDRLKMLRIDAIPVPTQMIELGSVWDGANGKFVNNSMSFPADLSPISTSRYVPIAFAIPCS